MLKLLWRSRAAWVLLWLLSARLPALAQIEKPVTWQYAAKAGAAGEATVSFTAAIAGDWHIYSQYIEVGGPEPTSFTFTPSPDYELLGKVAESPEPVKTFDKTFQMNIAYFPKRAVFTQRIRLKVPQTTVKGHLTFMACNDEKCLPPTDEDFAIEVKGTPVAAPAAATSATPGTPAAKAPAVAAPSGAVAPAATASVPAASGIAVPATPVAAVPAAADAPTATAAPAAAGPAVARDAARRPVAVTAAAPKSRSLWAIFWAGIVAGLGALIMPCIYPLLPFTVGYFTKQGHSRARGVGLAALYGLSIIVLYVGLGLAVTVIFGATILNEMATNGVVNFVFFALLLVFAASFLGAFELTLPNSWIAKADAQADKGGPLGIFFMAATLALVSFSCTGPLVGGLLVAASTGQVMEPVVGMLGFSLALALPFTLFAMFPTLLKALPKSGGWLNTVKVSFGFLELALALKFLSTVDLVYHWRWFDREVFLALWIVIVGLFGLYLLGKIRFAHDSDDGGRVGLPQFFAAIGVLAFTVYLVPGLWGAPLKAVSGFLPPQHTQDFDLYTPQLLGAAGPAAAADTLPHKYSDLFHAPLGLNAYFDYDEARAAAQRQHKPLLIDFTGNACTNCRKMEAGVWSDPAVLPLIRDKYVLVQLYVDDKTELPAAEQVTLPSGRVLNTIGRKWSNFQIARYQANSQPFYVLLNPATEALLAPPQGADFDPASFAHFLSGGLAAR